MSSCDEYLDLIGQKLDGCLSPADAMRLDAHLRQCPRCQAALDAYTWIEHGVASLTEEPPEDLHSRIMDAVAAEPKADATPQPSDDTIRALPVKKRKLFFGPGTAMAAVAAVLVLLVGTGKIPLPGIVTTTTTTTGASADTAARSVETETTVHQVSGTEFASAMLEGTEEVMEEAETEEATAVEEPAEAALFSDSMAVAEASDTSSLVLTESIALNCGSDESVTVYAYHPMVGCTTELIFPENVDDTQVQYSISDEAVAQVENGRILSTGEGTAVIVIWVDGWSETVVLDVATEETADVAADFWSAGFQAAVADDEDLTVVADNFLQADYLAMQSAVWMTDWEVAMWHYESVQVQSMGENAFCFSADWRLQVASDSAWDSAPLLGEAYLRSMEDVEDSHYQYATVFYLLEQSGDGLWQLAWQGSAMPDVTDQVRTGAASEAEMVQAQLNEDVAAGDVTLYLTEQGVNWLEQDGALYLTLPTEEAGAMLAQLETDFAIEPTEIEIQTAQPWVTLQISTVTDATEAHAAKSES